MKTTNNSRVWVPIFMALCIVIGMVIGTLLTSRSGKNDGKYMNKINALLSLIDEKYVDTVDQAKIVEDVLPQILGELDPHSVYFPAKDVVSANEEIEGSFSGVGIQFNIQDDTARVVSVVANGPSENA